MLNQRRVIIEKIYPELDGGLHPIKCIVGDRIEVQADVFSDGHDVIAASLLYKHQKERSWKEARMQFLENDRWTGQMQVEKEGPYLYKVEAWVDQPLNWQHGIERKIEDGQHVSSELLEGAAYLKEIVKRTKGADKKQLSAMAEQFEDPEQYDKALNAAVSQELHELLVRYPDKFLANESQELSAFAERKRAEFSTWYEFFPRSASEEPGVHGTFKDCQRLLPRIAEMGFDVLYLPPVHPIGEVNRKGKNNTTEAFEGDVGSTWGIGSKYGGHKDIHPELGTV